MDSRLRPFLPQPCALPWLQPGKLHFHLQHILD